METRYFKCTLLSDVILNQKSANEGENHTLDFIPGNVFLGIVAKEYGNFDKKEQISIFHSGQVRFGDAHPMINKHRTLRIPAALFHPKLDKTKFYVHHHTNLEDQNIKKIQLKQCRDGFYDFVDNEKVRKIDLCKSFAIKSAFDQEKRCSKDKQMFGYESLCKGAEFAFSIEFDIDDEEFIKKVCDHLVGKQSIGHSRSAQYGLAKIEPEDYKECESNPTSSKEVAIYADGRLIFINEEIGLPTFKPTLKQLGLPEGSKIKWEKSQIRTFQYAPYNGVRKSYDTDRCGIEKGSVIIVEIPIGSTLSPKSYIGSYQNEGFGKVIYNPSFLEADENGLTMLSFEKNDKVDNKHKEPLPLNEEEASTPLLSYIKKQVDIKTAEEAIIKQVNEFVDANEKTFKGESFASQWGSIRSIAMQFKTKDEIIDKLYGKGDESYLTHGVAKEQWEKKGRLNKLREFIKNTEAPYAQIAVINLSAEMAKICKK